MSRKKFFYPRIIKPDMKYKSIYVAKLINKIMKKGKKNKAVEIVYSTLEELSKLKQIECVELLTMCIKKVLPTSYLRLKKIASRTYRIPVAIQNTMANKIALKWIVDGSRLRKENGINKKLFHELKDILDGKGEALKKKENHNKTAKENEAFVHYG